MPGPDVFTGGKEAEAALRGAAHHQIRGHTRGQLARRAAGEGDGGRRQACELSVEQEARQGIGGRCEAAPNGRQWEATNALHPVARELQAGLPLRRHVGQGGRRRVGGWARSCASEAVAAGHGGRGRAGVRGGHAQVHRVVPDWNARHHRGQRHPRRGSANHHRLRLTKVDVLAAGAPKAICGTLQGVR